MTPDPVAKPSPDLTAAAAASLLRSLADPVLWIREGAIAWASPRIEPALGWRPGDLVGRRYDELVHPDDRQQAAVPGTTASAPSVLRRLRVRGNDGSHHWVEGHASPVLDLAGNRDGTVVCLRVVDDAVRAEQELTRRARFDPLTGLLNRGEVISRITGAGSHQRRSDTARAVLFCDIDHLKPVNDGMGHRVGDELLRQVATRIIDSIRAGDAAARFGGDEFLILLDGVSGLADALSVAAKVRSSVSAPMTVLGHHMQVTVSIGVALIEPGQDALDVIAAADEAMYAAKRDGRTGIASATAIARPRPSSRRD